MDHLYYVVKKMDDGFDVIIPMMNLSREVYTENLSEAMYTLNHMQQSFLDCVYELKQIEK